MNSTSTRAARRRRSGRTRSRRATTSTATRPRAASASRTLRKPGPATSTDGDARRPRAAGRRAARRPRAAGGRPASPAAARRSSRSRRAPSAGAARPPPRRAPATASSPASTDAATAARTAAPSSRGVTLRGYPRTHLDSGCPGAVAERRPRARSSARPGTRRPGTTGRSAPHAPHPAARPRPPLAQDGPSAWHSAPSARHHPGTSASARGSRQGRRRAGQEVLPLGLRRRRGRPRARPGGDHRLRGAQHRLGLRHRGSTGSTARYDGPARGRRTPAANHVAGTGGLPGPRDDAAQQRRPQRPAADLPGLRRRDPAGARGAQHGARRRVGDLPARPARGPGRRCCASSSRATRTGCSAPTRARRPR